MKLRNINRGLVLGAVLAAGVACYTVYDNTTFKKSKPDIEKAVDSYVSAMTQSNVGPQDKVSKQWCDLLDNYFTDAKSPSEYAETKASIYNSAVTFNSHGEKGEIISAEYDIKGISISKSGADGANVTVSYNVCYNVSMGDPTYLSTSGLTTMDSGNYTSSDDYSPSTEPYKAIFSCDTAELYMVRTSDGWKIASTTDYGFGDDYTFDKSASGSDSSVASTDIDLSSAEEADEADTSSGDDTASAADISTDSKEASAVD